MSTRILISSLFVVLAVSRGAEAQNARGMDPELSVTQYARDVWTHEDDLPQASISSIAQTPDGYLWLGTQEGVVRFDGQTFDVFSNFNEVTLRNTVSALYADSSNTLWVGTRGGGLSYYRHRRFHTITSEQGLVDDIVNAIVGDRTGAIWVATASGVSRVSPDTVVSFGTADGLPGDNVTSLAVDHAGVVWAGTSLGLAAFDGERFTTRGLPAALAVDITALMESENRTLWIGTRADGLFLLRRGSVTRPFRETNLPDGTIRAMTEDASGNVWIGFDKSGLARIHNQHVEVLDTDNGLQNRNIRALLQDREGSLWVGTDGGGLTRLRTGRFVNYTPTEGLPDETVFGVYADAQNQVWAGTDEGGVARISRGTIHTYDRRSGLPSNRVISISGTQDGSIWLGTDSGLARYREGRISVVDSVDGITGVEIYALFTDSRDRLWIGGSTLFRFDGRRFERFDESNGLSSTAVTVIAEDNMGDVWVGTYNGGLNRMRDNEVISVFDESNGLLSLTVTALHADPSGVMWVGMRDGGLARIGLDGKVTSYTTQSGLFDNSVHHIAADIDGAFWMTSNRGLFTVEMAQLEQYANGNRPSITPRAFNRADGLLSTEFNSGFQPAGAQTSDGRLWFPSTAGVVSISPAGLTRNEVAPKVVVDSVVIDGRRIENGDVVSPGRRRLDITYAGLSFIAPDRTRYQYILSGVDDGWREAGNSTTASYTNLKPGRYTFRVRAANADEYWSHEEVFAFTLKPYLYEQPAFAVAILVMLVLVGAGFHRLRVKRLKQQHRELEKLVAERTHDLQVEKDRTEEALLATEQARRDVERQKEIAERAREVIEEQADRLREMDRIKSRFFGNISHEFRTPLTLTIGPLENAITGVYGAVSPKLEKQLDLMLRNSRRLLRLINQLLDLSKLESGQFRLQPRRGNLTTVVEGVVLSFSAFAEMEDIGLEFRSEGVAGQMYFDIDSIEKVFFNLLSNAVKFTPNGGRIDVNVYNGVHELQGVEHEVAVVRVTDTGAGIPSSQLPHIFDRFHQVDGTVSRVQEGTGIGLALVKELVELHGGEITVESVVGRGTVFTVYLKKGLDHFDHVDESAPADDAETARGPMVEMAVFEDVDPGGDGAAGVAAVHDDGAPTILVVDDSQDIRQYIVECLSGAYRIQTASDGIDALEKIRKQIPDLILSDVMMPRMDGYGLCRTIKADPELRIIPFVLLTSKASVEARIEGLEAGSDDYLAKPFNARELRTRIENLLSLRRQSVELHELNKALVANNDALREASDLKSQLLNIASHDMKNPLTAIREFARIVKDELGTDSHLQELLDLIYSSSNEMLQLVTQLLDSAALEGGQLKLDKRPIDVAQLADIIVHRNRAQAKAKGQKIEYAPSEPGEAMVLADFNRLQEAMDNIVSNAIKYSPQDKTIYLSVERRNGSVEFRVRDEGPGLTEDDKSKLFGKFQKLSAQPTGGESSTGLGLSIVKQIIDLHGGSVRAVSEAGKGATFVIELSAIDPEPAHRPAPAGGAGRRPVS